jgi:thymidine kinase
MVPNGDFIRPGVLEVFPGCMFSFKTRRLVDRVRPLQHIPGAEYIFIKPKIDTRKPEVRNDPLDYAKWVYVEQDKPEKILDIVKPTHSYISIDEAHFFGDGFVRVIEKLLLDGKNIGIAGLDLDFRGEPFGSMPEILCIANDIYKGSAVCKYPGCGAPATRTQRLNNGKPADYNSPLVMIEGEAFYEPRCLIHHEVPGKPMISRHRDLNVLN